MDDRITSEGFRAVADLAGLSSGFEALFRAAPSPFLVLTSPDYTIIAVNDEYLRATMTERAAILGRRVFDVCPENPNSPSAAGPRELRVTAGRHRRTPHGRHAHGSLRHPAAGNTRWRLRGTLVEPLLYSGGAPQPERRDNILA